MQKLTFKTVSHEAFGDDERENLSMKCIRYFRFEKSVTVREIVLHPVNIRHVPVVTGQPKHILIETFDRKTETWKTVCDLTLPLFDEKHPHRIGTNGFRTELIRLICDEEHRVPPSRGEWYASPDVVPIRIFENTEIFGEECSSLFLPPYNPPLTKGKTAPSAIANTEISVKEHLVSYKSRYMHLVFSLKRPILLKMAFDPEGNGKTDVNILYDKTVWQAEFIGRPNCVIGPRFVSATQNLNSMSFTGEVELDGNAVLYKNLHCNDLFSMDLRFSVSETGFTVSVNKTCHTDFTAIESDDFDFVLDCDKTISGIQGVPCRNHSRVGTVSLPAVLCCPGIAGLDLTSSEQSPCVIQVDTIRSSRMSWFSPIVGGERDRYGFIRFHAGTYHASFSVSLGGIRPAFLEKIADPALYRTFWKGLTAALAFRSDFVGFSNNFLSGNCHNSEYHIAEMAPYFTGAKNGLSVRDLLRFTVECSLKNGPGYGDNRELYLDADPSILIAAARLYQLTRDDAWLTKYWKHIRTIADRILNNIENGTDPLLRPDGQLRQQGMEQQRLGRDQLRKLRRLRQRPGISRPAERGGDGKTSRRRRGGSGIPFRRRRNRQKFQQNPSQPDLGSDQRLGERRRQTSRLFFHAHQLYVDLFRISRPYSGRKHPAKTSYPAGGTGPRLFPLRNPRQPLFHP